MNKSIFWHQGLFLQPQHFQYNDRRQEQQQFYLHSLLNPHCWGVIETSINTEAIGKGFCELSTGSFLLKDGAIVSFPELALLETRNFMPDWADKEKPFPIYVGIKKWDNRNQNVSLSKTEELDNSPVKRFVALAEVEKIPDAYQTGPAAEMRTLYYRLQFLWEAEVESNQDYEVIQIAEVIMEGETPILNNQYIPPCLHLSASTALLNLIKLIRDELGSRIRQLENYKISIRDAISAGFDNRTLPYRLVLSLLSNYAPQLDLFYKNPKIHPWQAYSFLRQLCGGLSILSDQIDCFGVSKEGEHLLSSYKHPNLTDSFFSLYKLIIQLLNTITFIRETLVSFNRVEGHIFEAEIPSEVLNNRNSFHFMLTTQTEPEILAENFLSQAIVGTADAVQIFADRSLPGLTLKHFSRKPDGLPDKIDAHYFGLDQRSEIWQEIQQSQNIKVMWEGAPEDVKIDLIILRR